MLHKASKLLFAYVNGGYMAPLLINIPLRCVVEKPRKNRWRIWG